jgi:hypothetical protein
MIPKQRRFDVETAEGVPQTISTTVPERVRPSRGGSRAFGYLFVAISNPTFTQIVWRHLDAHAIAYQDTDAVLTHLPGNGSQDYMLGIIELNFEKRVGLFVDYCALRRNKIISCQ